MTCVVAVLFGLFCVSLATKIEKDSNGLTEVTAATWDEVVMNPNYDVVVQFYSPSCSYCQRFAPIWTEIGKYFLHEDTVLIVKIDATKHRIPGHDITAVPVIKIFPANTKNQNYEYIEHRALNLIIEWILEMVALPVEVSITYKSAPAPENNDGPVKEVVGTTFKDIVLQPEKDVFVNYYAPWCPYCVRLEPIWKQFGERLKDVPSVVVAQFDGTQNEVPGLHLHAYPTLILHRAGDKHKVEYPGFVRTVDAFLEFLQKNAVIPFTDPVTGKRSKEIDSTIPHKNHAAEVAELDDNNWRSVLLDPDVNALALFYAPWCEHSQELFATWEELAKEYKFISSVKIVQMDVDKHKSPGIAIYPTIRLYPAGDQTINPDGISFKGKETTAQNLKKFIQEFAVKSSLEVQLQQKVATAQEAQKRGYNTPPVQDHELPHPETGRSLIYKEEL